MNRFKIVYDIETDNPTLSFLADVRLNINIHDAYNVILGNKVVDNTYRKVLLPNNDNTRMEIYYIYNEYLPETYVVHIRQQEQDFDKLCLWEKEIERLGLVSEKPTINV